MARRAHLMTQVELQSRLRRALKNDCFAVGGGVSITANGDGTGRWVFRYNRPSGKQNQLGLGGYPVVSLSSARLAAGRLLGQVAQGVDPSAARSAEKLQKKQSNSGSFSAVAELWYEHQSKGWRSDETRRKARMVLDTYLLPRLKTMKIADLTTADVAPVLLDLHSRAPNLARKAMQFCSQIVHYAIRHGLREDGRFLSTRGLLPRAGARGHMAAVTRGALLPGLLSAIHGIGSENSRNAILLALLTAARPGEVAGARWSEIDFEAREWHVPSDRMKAGNAHISPLSRQSIHVLEKQLALANGSPFVFPGALDPQKKHINRDSLSKILRENGLRGVTVAHGFRATFRTLSVERLGALPAHAEEQLAHAKKGEVQAAYDRAKYLDQRHELMQRWADYLDGFGPAGHV